MLIKERITKPSESTTVPLWQKLAFPAGFEPATNRLLYHILLLRPFAECCGLDYVIIFSLTCSDTSYIVSTHFQMIWFGSASLHFLEMDKQFAELARFSLPYFYERLLLKTVYCATAAPQERLHIFVMQIQWRRWDSNPRVNQLPFQLLAKQSGYTPPPSELTRPFCYRIRMSSVNLLLLYRYL